MSRIIDAYRQFTCGIQYFFAGLGLITQPGLRRFVLIPLAINLLFFILLFIWLQQEMKVINTWLIAFLPAWLVWLSGLVWLIFFMSFSLMMVYLFVTMANLVAAPFNSFLMEKVEWHLTQYRHPAQSLLTNLKATPRVIARQFGIMIYYLLPLFPLIILLLIPFLHALAVVLWVGWNAWFLALTYLDYPADYHEVSLSKTRQWLRQHRWQSLGFGMAILMTSLVPLLNFVVMPAAVAGASVFWLNESENDRAIRSTQ